MIRKIVAAALACTALSSPALAQTAAPDTKGEDNIVVTAARTILPPNALPLTVDVIGKEALDQQVLISGSVTDAVATLTPSFSPTRQKLSGAGDRRSMRSMAFRNRPRCATAAATASPSTASSSTGSRSFTVRTRCRGSAAPAVSSIR
jgi:hypothetical protein